MDYIKDKEQCISLVNKLIISYGGGKIIAGVIDEFIFDYLDKFMTANESGCNHVGNMIHTMKEVRNLFSNMEINKL